VADRWTSSPGASDVREYQNTKTTAFQSISNDVLLNRNTLYADPYVKYLAASGDPVKSADEFNRLYAGLVGTASSAGSKFNNAFEELQALLRANKYSNGKSAIGIVDTADRTGLAKAIQDSLGMGQTDVIQFLTALSASGGRGSTVVKQPDTSKKFNTQITRALQYKDLGDATRALTDAYMLAFTTAPTQELITDFQKKWNKEVEAQTPTVTTATVTEYAPIYDKKSGKVFDKTKPVLTAEGKPKKDSKGNIVYQQKVDKFGNPVYNKIAVNAEGVKQYKTVTSPAGDGSTVSTGEGFTAEEQQSFMANYIAANYPGQDWNLETIGGAAKNVYDAISEVNRNNFEKIPTFQEAASTITQIIGTGNSQVASELLQKYIDNTRSKTAKRFMSLADDINAGNDAKPIVDSYLDKASTALETTINLDDPLALSIFNFMDEQGNYRLPNELEFAKLLDNDYRSARTSRKINEAVNLAQSLAQQLQIG
jgi:hypothetical protein